MRTRADRLNIGNAFAHPAALVRSKRQDRFAGKIIVFKEREHSARHR